MRRPVRGMANASRCRRGCARWRGTWAWYEPDCPRHADRARRAPSPCPCPSGPDRGPAPARVPSSGPFPSRRAVAGRSARARDHGHDPDSPGHTDCALGGPPRAPGPAVNRSHDPCPARAGTTSTARRHGPCHSAGALPRVSGRALAAGIWTGAWLFVCAVCVVCNVDETVI